jgi:outer membrane protein TolC
MTSLHRRPPRFAVGCAWAAFAALLAGPTWADPAPAFETLLAQIGLTPSAVEADALLDAAEARVHQARVPPNPTLSLEAENAFGSGPFSGYDNAETTLSLTQDLELWGRRGARVEVARAEAGTASLRRDQAVVDAAATARTRLRRSRSRRAALRPRRRGAQPDHRRRPRRPGARGGGTRAHAAGHPGRERRPRPPAPPVTKRRPSATRRSPV